MSKNIYIVTDCYDAGDPFDSFRYYDAGIDETWDD